MKTSRRIAFSSYPAVCDGCGRSGINLEVHHRNLDPGDNSPDNLRILCRPCHDDEHRGKINPRRFPQPLPGAVTVTIRQLREERGWSQKELAAQLEVTRATVARWESAKAATHPPPLMARLALAHVFRPIEADAIEFNGPSREPGRPRKAVTEEPSP